MDPSQELCHEEHRIDGKPVPDQLSQISGSTPQHAQEEFLDKILQMWDGRA